jgi:hypothetical protein
MYRANSTGQRVRCVHCTFLWRGSTMYRANSTGQRVHSPFISVSDPDPYWIRIQIRSVDPDPGGQNDMVLGKGWMFSFEV